MKEVATRHIKQSAFANESKLISQFTSELQSINDMMPTIQHDAKSLISDIRHSQHASNLFQSFLKQYDLGSREGVLLMCLAESLIRIPDKETANRLIRDKLAEAEWEAHLGQSPSFLVNASSWGLMLTGSFMRFDKEQSLSVGQLLKRVIGKSSEGVVRTILQKSMSLMGGHFVMGETIESAVKRSFNDKHVWSRVSYDMLGEAALTEEDARHYFDSYAHAINTLGQLPKVQKINASISIKLSALHPRYRGVQAKCVLAEATGRILDLVCLAKTQQVAVTIDAEEAAYLELQLSIFECVFAAEQTKGWPHLGLAVQAYQRRAHHVIGWLVKLSKKHNKKIPVRLVKGAYWDTEIKRAQQLGLEDYPVFTKKSATDVAYLASAKRMLQACDAIDSQFATHNALTVASVIHLAKSLQVDDYEFQCLHGMGDALYAGVAKRFGIPCRVYAPVGQHKELLPYLIRRLLENGANSSFVHQLSDDDVPIETLVSSPIEEANQQKNKHPIAVPSHLFGRSRKNSLGFDIDYPEHKSALDEALEKYKSHTWEAKAWCTKPSKNHRKIFSPADSQTNCGNVTDFIPQDVDAMMQQAQTGFKAWSTTTVDERATCLENMADLLEANRVELMALCIKEAGKTVQDGIDEIREAVDFCRYYAVQARQLQGEIITLPGPTGERNTLSCVGRGVFVCISPWNFPLAIFIGQVAAALVTGNTVIAKPAEQTSLIAGFACKLFVMAGIPEDVLYMAYGLGEDVGPAIITHPAVAGVVFTGSTNTAKLIQRQLAEKPGAIVPLIAETGGQNAMIVDSSALPEQVVKDVMQSSFNSAGQRCSALRALFLQADTADVVIDMIKGAMRQLKIGDPMDCATDLGPVIDDSAHATLTNHLRHIQSKAIDFFQVRLPEHCRSGVYFAPTLIEIEHLSQLQQEVFGPVLHVIRYQADKLGKVIEQVNATGFGLTFGIHSRIERLANQISQQIEVGNVYINRNMVGAVVGVQPFGGRGLSGTGPKAGGPHYLTAFVTEKTISINTAAIGGNIELLNQA